MEMMLLELFSIVSLTFSVLIVLFEVPQVKGVILLVYVMAVSALFLWKKVEGRFGALFMGTLFFLPYFTEVTQENAFFTVIYSVIFTLYFYRKMGTLYPEDVSLRLKISYVFMILSALLGIWRESWRGMILAALPFMLLYFFVTIILTTSIRHRQAGLDENRNRRNILFYLGLTSVLSIAASIEEFRNIFLVGFRSFSGIFSDIFFKALYLIASVVFFFYEKLISFIKNLPKNQNPENAAPPEGFGESFEETVAEIQSSPLMENLFSILMILIIVYVLVKFIRGRRGKRNEELPYEEVREFIMNEKDSGRRKRREKYPTEYREQIRYYYRIYLQNLAGKVKLEKYDTSLTVRDKGERVHEHNEEIRNIYAEHRYTDRSADESVVRKLKEYVEKS